jgi:8-oxo-dGTP pyrophosphatase MutT (NUDIX family)/broad specificity phosphatase PhoE
MAEAVKPIRAAGGVLWRPASGRDDQVEIAVIHRPRYDDWSLPKGKLAPGESTIDGAVREVLEETGFRVRVGRPLGEVRYTKSSGSSVRPKVVRYWAMEADGGSFSPSREVDELKWLDVDSAREILTRETDVKVLDRFVRGPTLSGYVILVRHGRAGERSKWEGDDRLRPLDGLGVRQAEELVRPLSRFEVEEIISADFDRCVQTMLPLSEAIGVPIREEELFSELGYPAHEEEAIHLVRKLGESLSSTVVCSQGDVIPDLLQRLAEVDHVDLPEGAHVKKAGVCVLTFDGPRLFEAELFPPPSV